MRATGPLREKLKRLRSDTGYNIDRLFAVIQGQTGQIVSQVDRSWDDPRERLRRDADIGVIDTGIVERRREMAAVVSSSPLPPTVARHLAAIQGCYAFGLSTATIVFCRAVIESALYDLCRRQKLLDEPTGTLSYDEYSAAAIRRKARPKLPPRLFDAACGESGVVKMADRILHSKQDPPSASEEQALAAIRSTLALLEAVYQ